MFSSECLADEYLLMNVVLTTARPKYGDRKTQSRASDQFRHRLHVDVERFQEFGSHDVEADGELQLDQRAGSQFRSDGVEGRIRRPAQLDDLVGEGERRALYIVEAGGLLPVVQRLILRVGDADILADPLVRHDL